MKKLFLFAAAVSVALTSCVKSEVGGLDAGQKEITYEVAK